MRDISNRLTKGKYILQVESIEVIDTNPYILFWVSLPTNHRGQTVTITSISPEPTELITDVMNGNLIAFWKFTDIANKETLRFSYDFQILAEDVEIDIDYNKIESYDTQSESYQFYIKSEPWIEITPAIKQKALELIGDESNPYLCAKQFFYWVIENMSYKLVEIADRGTEKSFHSLSGDCGEFSTVFIALCRAIGIPAREVVAVWPQEPGHAWAEVFLPPYGWVPVDATIAQLKYEDHKNTTRAKSGNRDYYFGNLYPNRIIVFKGNNIQVITKKDNLFRHFMFMQPGAGYCYPCSIEFYGISDKVRHTGIFVFDEEIENETLISQKINKDYVTDYFMHKDKQSILDLLHKDNTLVLGWFYLGQLYLRDREIEEAINCFTHSINDNVLPVEALCWAYNLLADCYHIQKNYNNARFYYNKVITEQLDYQGSIAYAQSSLYSLSSYE